MNNHKVKYDIHKVEIVLLRNIHDRIAKKIHCCYKINKLKHK